MKLLSFLLLLFGLQKKCFAQKNLVLSEIKYLIDQYKYIFCSASFSDYQVSTECAKQLEVTCRNEEILITMIDASSKFPYTGHLHGSRWDLGNYDECLSIDYSENGERVLGKYCIVGYIVPDPKNISNMDLAYRLSTCQPDKCSLKDLQVFIQNYSREFNVTHDFDFNEIIETLDKTCSTKETGKEYTTGNVMVIGLFSAWAATMALSTVYDVYLYLNNKNLESSSSYITAFSVFTNSRKVLEITENTKKRILVLDGLRAVSIIWVIAGHGFASWEPYIPIMNLEEGKNFIYKRTSSYILAGRLSVVTFFFMSGFFFSYQFMKSQPQRLPILVKSIPFLYLHRYLRLTPSYAMIYLFGMWIYPKLGSGPLWQYAVETDSEKCRRHWWEYFLYIQNYMNYDDLCGIPFWYLSADMQLFLLAPLLMVPLTLLLNQPNGFYRSMTVLTVLAIISLAATISSKLYFSDYPNNFDTHSRLTEYVIGIMMGLFMSKKRYNPFLPMVEKSQLQIANFLMWCLILFGMFVIVLFYQDIEAYAGHTRTTLFLSFARPSWCIGLCWVIYSCYHGYGGIVNWILTRPISQIISKLSYSMYTVHYMVIGYYLLSNRSRLHFSSYAEFHIFCGYLIETIIIAFIWTLAFDAPVAVIEKALLTRDNKDIKEEKSTVDINHCNEAPAPKKLMV